LCSPTAWVTKAKTSLTTAIKYAQRADAIIYPIFFADPLVPYRPLRTAILATSRARGKQTLERMASETGGSYFEVTKDHPVEEAYSQIEDALRNQYSLGYTPGRKGPAGEYRKVQLTVDRPGVAVQTRNGYYSK
jgi:VWFA-related protein